MSNKLPCSKLALEYEI